MIKIILDFETSGLNPYHDDIIEVAMKVMGSDNSYCCLIKPKSNECISNNITRITGITNKMLAKEGLDWEEAYKQINDWLLSLKSDNVEKYSIISHNGESFDFIFLRRIFHDLNSMNIQTLNDDNILYIDTLLLSKRLLKNRSSYSQKNLCSHYNISSEGNHRAMNDVIALEELFNSLIHDLNKITNDNLFDKFNIINDYIKIKL
jgi:DNA polymerase III epsilon subunit-like protein